MIEKISRHKKQRDIRQWANRHSEDVYKKLGRICNDCKSVENLTIHHKEYIKGIEYLEILCQTCHRSFHNKELKKRLLHCVLDEIENFEHIFANSDSLIKFKEWILKRANKIPVKIIPNMKIDGFAK